MRPNSRSRTALRTATLALALLAAAPAVASGTATRASRPNFTADAEMAQAMSVSSVGLAERSSELPGGGVLLDLKGRFRSVVVGTARKGRPPAVSCVEPGSLERSEVSDARR